MSMHSAFKQQNRGAIVGFNQLFLKKNGNIFIFLDFIIKNCPVAKEYAKKC